MFVFLRFGMHQSLAALPIFILLKTERLTLYTIANKPREPVRLEAGGQLESRSIDQIQVCARSSEIRIIVSI